MKIAINILPVASGMTGIGQYTHELLGAAQQLTPGRHEVIYIRRERDRHGTRDDIVPTDASPMWEQLHLPTELQRRGVDLYHSPVLTCPLVRAVPSVITLHDCIPERRPDLCSPQFLAYYRQYAAPCARACVRVVTVSEFSKHEICACFDLPEEKVAVLPQSISARFCREARNKSLPNGFPSRYVLAVGMLEPRKNLELLIQAFAKTAGELPDLHLVLVGRTDSPTFTLEPAIRQSGVAERIHLTGYLDDAVMPAVYAHAEALAFPSLYEGFGRPAVEAMASGVPVICADSTSLPEVVGHAGLLLPPDDVTALAQGLIQVATNQEQRTRMIAAGLTRAQSFTTAAFAERLLAFYDSLEAEQCG